MTHIEERIRAEIIIAILRGEFRWHEVQEMTAALIEHGVRVIEYTLNSPNALQMIEHLKGHFGADVLVGAGTLLSMQDYQNACAAGAEFLVSPHWSEDLSDRAKSDSNLLIPGVFTPSEVYVARQHGWRLQKLFPANVGGPGHLKALRGPFHDVDFIPTGGIDENNARAYLNAGASAIGVGSALVRPGVTFEEIRDRVVQLRAEVDQGRER